MLQKILATSDDIATVSEPWLMLPLFSYDERMLMCSAYSVKGYRKAVRDILGSLPCGEDDLFAASRAYGEHLYGLLAGEGRYFLDKTPRYHIISSHLMRTFPEAKCIFLWRNPLSVMASISRTWKKGRWTFAGYEIDLYEGFASLIESYEGNQERVLALQYEDLVADPNRWLGKIQTFLDLPEGSFKHELFGAVDLGGKMGDSTGAKEYQNTLSEDSTARWKQAFRSRYRKKMGAEYLQWIGAERLETMGYSLDELMEQLTAVPATGLGVMDYLAHHRGKLKDRSQSRLSKAIDRYRGNGGKAVRLN
ncbi:sulfotransferase [Verrucomicrobiaceae bacterium N1E253]|uniref:Sulfotransferase n=1 Tax=Oceaniferula marina TaxID=2748318 RepID=A0A851GLX0_9BACT|nr:sulfotransferase [Oceaniferula marina]